VLGHGGFGITYLATDTLLQEAVAIKEYLPNDLAIRISDATVRPKSAEDKPSFEAGLKAFLEEARLLARIRHSDIIRVRRFFELHGTGYIVQDFEEGKTLGKRLSERPLSETELRAIMSGVLDGLEEVHERAVLHRDLKPNNIMLRGNGTAVLIDFGAARDFKSRHSRSVTAIATPGYTPPEQFGIGGQQGPWTDLYALGAILYRCVTGAPPVDSLRRLRNDPLVPAAVAAEGKYSAALLGAIDWMLQVDEAKRPGSVQAVREALSSGRVPEQSEQKSALSLTIKAAGPGRVLIELPDSIRADVLELSFFVTPPGQYLTPSLSGKPVWRNQPHYLEVYRSEGAAGRASFEVGAEIVNAIPAQAQVTISSADGFIHGSAIWSGTPAAVAAAKPKRRWPIAAAAAVLAMVALPIAGYGLYVLYQKQQEENLRQLTRQLEEARFDAAALRLFQTACGSSCPENLRNEAKSRLDHIATEEASFRAAQDDVTRLRAYINECRACTFKAEAETRVARLEQQRTQRPQQQAEDQAGQREQQRGERMRQEEATYRATQGDELKLRTYISSCTVCVYIDAARREISEIEARRQRQQHTEAEEQKYRASRGNLNGLREYVATCNLCAYASQARNEIAAIEERGRQQERIQQEEQAYRSARGNISALRRYLETCSVCSYGAEARAEIARLGNVGGPFVPVTPPSSSPRTPAALPQSDPPRGTSIWNHNGSLVYLSANGASRRFYYERPRDGLLPLGVQRGTLLFEGRKEGNRYSGTAYIFTRNCSPAPYEVSGPISPNDEQVTMHGRAPLLNAACQTTGYRDDVLVFTYQQSTSR
jgi:serine/threonine protein kinase